MDFQRIAVFTVLDEQGGVLPESFTLRDRHVEVREVLDRWHEGGAPGRPEVRYFKVSDSYGRRFILRYAAVFDAWGACEVD